MDTLNMYLQYDLDSEDGGEDVISVTEHLGAKKNPA